MRNRTHRTLVLCAAVAATVSASTAMAVDGTWIVQSGSWGAPASWQGGTIASGAGALADFSTVDLTAAGTVTLDGNRTAGTATFGDATLSSAFGWNVNSGTPATSSLTLQGAGGSAGTLNVGYINGDASRGLANGQGVGIAAPLLAPNGLNINLGEFGAGVIGRRNNLAISNTGGAINGTLSINGIGDVNASGGQALLAGVTNVNITNPFTVIGGAQGAGNRVTSLTLAPGTYNFATTLNGGPIGSDARPGLISGGAGNVVVNGNATLLGGTPATYQANAGTTLTLNGDINGTGGNAGLLLRGAAGLTINGNINLNVAQRATVAKTDDGTVTVNGAIDAYAIAPVGGGVFRLGSFGDVSANTRIFTSGPALQSTGSLTRPLSTAPGGFAGAGNINLGAASGTLTVNFGGAAAPILFGDALVVPVVTGNGISALDLNGADAATSGITVGSFVTGTGIPATTLVAAVPGGFGPTTVDIDTPATADGSINASFLRGDRINGTLNLNAGAGTGDVNVLNPIDLNAPATGTAAAPTVRTINANRNTVTLSGAVTNTGPGVATLAKGGNGTLVIAAPVTLNGNFRFLGGSLVVNPGVAVNVNAFEISGGSINSTSINAVTAPGGIFLNGGTIDLPASTTGTLNYTIGTPIPGVTTSNVIFSNPDGTTGNASGLNNTSGSPLTITYNNNALLQPGITPGFNLRGFKLGATANATTTITNDFAIMTGNVDFLNESTTGVELVIAGNQTGATTGALTMTGSGIVAFRGTSAHSGQTRIFSGTLGISQPGALGTLSTGNDVPMDSSGAQSVLRFDAPMTITAPANGNFQISSVGANNFTLDTNGNAVTLQDVILNGARPANTNGGRLIKTGAGVLTANVAGTTSNAQQISVLGGTLSVGGGTLAANGGAGDRVVVGSGANTAATLAVNGATVSTTGSIFVGRDGANGTLTVNSGALNAGGGELILGAGTNAASVATFNQNGGASNIVFIRNSDGAANGSINLNGGSLLTTRISRAGTGVATFNANGGTLSPRTDAGRANVLPTFFQGVDNARILEGGLKIDTLGQSTQTFTGAGGGSFTMTLNQNFQHGGSAAIDGGIAKLGDGNVILGGTSSYTGPTDVQVGTLTANAPRAFGAGRLQVAGGAIADTAASLASPLVIGDISIAAGGTVQLRNNKLVVDYTGAAPLANVKNAILPFFGTGTYDGTTGLTTSPVPASNQGVGYADTAASGFAIPAAFAGSADATSIIVQVTLKGDTNIDGTVGFADLVTLAQNYNQGSKFWQQGDFNFDGTVGFPDLVSLAQNYNQSLGIDGGVVPIGAASAFAADWALAQSMVPEPTTLAGLGLLAATFGRRRRVAK